MKKIFRSIAFVTLLCLLASCNEKTAFQQNARSAAPVEGGSASTSENGKKTDIQLIANASIQLGLTTWKKDEVVHFSVESDQAQSVEVGFISTSSKVLTSEIVTTGTGTFTLTVPNDDEYSLYAKNNTASDVRFTVVIDKPMDRPGI